MQQVLQALNRLIADGVIESYAIGGAIAAAFYIQALQTEDVDAFLYLHESASNLVSLEPIYSALQAYGGVIEREYVRFGTWPLQILSDANPLIHEAIRDALNVTFEEVPTKVFRAEHLCAIALQTGRRKDKLRVSMFLEQNAVDRETLSALLGKHGLSSQFQKLMSSE